MRKILFVVVAALLLLAGSTLAAQAQGVIGGGGLSQAQLQPQNGSGEEGTVTLGSDGKITTVTIELSGAPNGVAQPAHIHEGTCANLNPKPAYPLNPVINGSSVTTLTVPITDLLGDRYSVNVHKSDTEVNVYVACGTLGALMSGGTAPGGGGNQPGMPGTGAGMDSLGLLAVLLAAALLVGAGWAVRRRRTA